MTPIPESTMREAIDLNYRCCGLSKKNADVVIATALHAARQDQIRKDAEIARQHGHDARLERVGERPSSVGSTGTICLSIGAESAANAIATAIETQGGEK